MPKSILCPVSGGPADRVSLDAAAVLADRFAAHVHVLHARPDPADAAPYLGEGMSASLIAQIMDAAESRAAREAETARAAYDAWRRERELPLAEVPTPHAIASCAWSEETGAQDAAIARLGRLCDLTVLPSLKLDAGIGSTLAFEAALLDTGRPVLLAAARALRLDGVVVVAWNGSVEAARAVAASLPFLQMAREVHVTTVEEGGRSADPAAVVRYLAWHRIAAQPQAVAGTSGAAAAIAEACTARGADLLVMGGYTHSRLRELIFGGVTAHMLGEGAIPVLLSH